MSNLSHPIRWLLAVPLGYFAGLAATGLFLGFFGALLGRWWLSGCAVLLIGSVILPVVGYRVSQAIAPPRGRLGRWALLFPYWVLSGSSAFVLGRLLLGEHPPGDPLEFLPAVSDWWCSFTFALGMMIGVGRITELSSLHAGRDAFIHSPVSTFEWRCASN